MNIMGIEQEIKILQRQVNRLKVENLKTELALTAAVDNSFTEFLAGVDTRVFERLLKFLESEAERVVDAYREGQINLEQFAQQLEPQIKKFFEETQQTVLERVVKEADLDDDVVTGFKSEDGVAAEVAATLVAALFVSNVVEAATRSDAGQRVDKIVRPETVRAGLSRSGGVNNRGAGIGGGDNTRNRLGLGGVRPVALRWVLGNPEIPDPRHEALGGSVVEDIAEWGGLFPDDHKGCQCRIQYIYERDLGE